MNGEIDLTKAPLQQLGEHDLIYDSKRILNYLQLILPTIVQNSLRLRPTVIDETRNWNLLSRNSIYPFSSLDGPNAPDSNQIGDTAGYVITFNNGKNLLLQLVIGTSTQANGLAYRGGQDTLVGQEWHYLMDNTAQEAFKDSVNKLVADTTQSISQLIDTNRQDLKTAIDNFQKNADNVINATTNDVKANALVQLTVSFNALSSTYSAQFDEWESILKAFNSQLDTKLGQVDDLIEHNFDQEVLAVMNKKIVDLKNAEDTVQGYIDKLQNLVDPSTITFTQALPKGFLDGTAGD